MNRFFSRCFCLISSRLDSGYGLIHHLKHSLIGHSHGFAHSSLRLFQGQARIGGLSGCVDHGQRLGEGFDGRLNDNRNGLLNESAFFDGKRKLLSRGSDFSGLFCSRLRKCTDCLCGDSGRFRDRLFSNCDSFSGDLSHRLLCLFRGDNGHLVEAFY